MEMKALISFLSAALSFAVCDGSQVLQLPTEYDGKNRESACDETRFIAERELCDAAFGLILPRNQGNDRFACSFLEKYETCVANLVRETGCQHTGFLKSQLEPMKQFFRNNNIVCTQRLNAATDSGAPDQRPSVDHGLCAQTKVWAKQFLCASEFHASIEKIRRNEETQPLPVCRSVANYYVCLSTALQNESCADDEELSQHMEYFPKALTEKYREMCVAEMKLASTNVDKRLKVQVLRAVGAAQSGDAKVGVCDGEEATKRFFECGLRFNWIVSQNPPKTKLCAAYRVFMSCSTAIAEDMHCDSGSDFVKHATHVTGVLAEQYEHYCTPPKPSSCNEDAYLQMYFECGLKFVFSVRDAMFSDPATYNDVLCDIQRAHVKCVESAKNASHCLVPIGIQTSIDFLDSELLNSSGKSCPHVMPKVQIARARAKFRPSKKQSCNIREYAGSYFSCGTTFIKGTHPNRPPKDEDCKLYEAFMRCISLLIVCRSPGDVESSLKHFTDVLTVGYPELCRKDIENKTALCDKMVLLKEFMSCGLAYYQLFFGLDISEESGKQHNCMVLNEYHNCINDHVLSKKCDGLDELFANIKLISQYIAQRYDLKLHTSCSKETQKTAVSLRQEQRSPCDQFKAVKQLVLCGVTFHRMLVAFTGNRTAQNLPVSADRAALVCPLLDEMKDCVQAATNDSGCSGAILLNAEISVLKKHLFQEFYTMCKAAPSTNVMQPHHQSCGLKDFTQAWESCDAMVEDDISLFYRNGSGYRKAVMSRWVRRRLCNDLIGYRKCLNDSADRHHCAPLVPEVTELSNELLHRLGSAYCSAGGLAGGWGAVLLAASASALNLLAQRQSIRVT